MKDGLGDLHPSRAVARRMHELETELLRARTHLRRHSKSPETTGRWGLEQPSAPQQEEGWFITYLDMMTLLLVVMIVMLAFSGTVGERLGRTPLDDLRSAGAASVGTRETAVHAVHAPIAIEPQAAAAPPTTPVPADEAVRVAMPASTAAIDPVSPADPALPEETADGSGLLPGGSGLLPGHEGLAGADAAAGSAPGQAAADHGPSILAHPADVGPLPRDAMVMAGKIAGLPDARSPSRLYPGWSAAYLAASFIGPPRPGGGSAAIQARGPAMTTGEGDIDVSAGFGAEPAAVGTSPSEPALSSGDTSPSSGEALAASLALSELGNDVEIVISERSVNLRVNSEILFDTSQADLSRSGLSVLRNILGVLSKTNGNITIEGHTDSVPVRRNVRYPSNWELSSARAGSVVRYLQANGVEKTRLKAIGYADTRPIADNHTPDGRARNRRVELVIEKRAPD